MKTGKNHQKFFVLPFQHCIALVQLKCIISYKIWIARVSFYFLEKWIFHFEIFFCYFDFEKNNLFFFRSQCGRQQQNNIWGLTSVCSMLPESYSASAPKATKEGTAKSERQEFPKPRKTAINQPLGDLRITENCPTSFIRRSCSWNISIQNREGKRDGQIEKTGPTCRSRYSSPRLSSPSGTNSLTWQRSPWLRWNHERSSRWKSVIMILS